MRREDGDRKKTHAEVLVLGEKVASLRLSAGSVRRGQGVRLGWLYELFGAWKCRQVTTPNRRELRCERDSVYFASIVLNHHDWWFLPVSG